MPINALTNNQVRNRYNKLKKTEKEITHYCDLIYWFVDVLGSEDIMNIILQDERANSVVEFVKRKGQLQAFASTNTKQGVVFVGNAHSGGHYHSMYKGIIQDSYTLGYQLKGTNNFCQLFAIMIYLQTVNPIKYNFDLQVGKYAHNITVAMRFLKTILRKNKDIRDKFVDDIRRFQSRDFPDDETWIFLVKEPKQLYNMTIHQLFEYIDNVAVHGQKFTNC